MARRSSGEGPHAVQLLIVCQPVITPAPVHQAPPPAPVESGGGSMLGGLGATIAQGMVFGTGNAVAHRAVDGVMGPRTIQQEIVGSAATTALGPASDACGMHSVHQAPPPAPVESGGGSVIGGLGATIAQGMVFGTGNAVAHRAVDGVILGPRAIQHEIVGSAAATALEPASDACGMHSEAFTKCLNSAGSDISKCQFYMDMLNECRNSSGSMIWGHKFF